MKKKQKIFNQRDDDGKTIKQSLDQLFYTTTDQIADVNNKTICEFLIGYRLNRKGGYSYLTQTNNIFYARSIESIINNTYAVVNYILFLFSNAYMLKN